MSTVTRLHSKGIVVLKKCIISYILLDVATKLSTDVPVIVLSRHVMFMFLFSRSLKIEIRLNKRSMDLVVQLYDSCNTCEPKRCSFIPSKCTGWPKWLWKIQFQPQFQRYPISFTLRQVVLELQHVQGTWGKCGMTWKMTLNTTKSRALHTCSTSSSDSQLCHNLNRQFFYLFFIFLQVLTF